MCIYFLMATFSLVSIDAARKTVLNVPVPSCFIWRYLCMDVCSQHSDHMQWIWPAKWIHLPTIESRELASIYWSYFKVYTNPNHRSSRILNSQSHRRDRRLARMAYIDWVIEHNCEFLVTCSTQLYQQPSVRSIALAIWSSRLTT